MYKYMIDSFLTQSQKSIIMLIRKEQEMGHWQLINAIEMYKKSECPQAKECYRKLIELIITDIKNQ